MILIALAIFFGLLIWRSFVSGTYYVKFDGGRYGGPGTYEVWRRDFAGFDELCGSYRTRNAALERVKWLKDHPPRVVR